MHSVFDASPRPLYSSRSSKAPVLAVAECKALNSDMGPSHTGWISEFTALTLQPRRGIQWKTSEAFQLGQSWGCCCAGWTGLCLRCCSAAICRAWLGCSSPILLIPLCSQQSQPRVKASLDARYMPKDADSHTMCSWPALVTGMLLTWHARDFVLVFSLKKKQHTTTHQHTTQISPCEVLSFTLHWVRKQRLSVGPSSHTYSESKSWRQRTTASLGHTEPTCRTHCLGKLEEDYVT